jgi:hypothetical protein
MGEPKAEDLEALWARARLLLRDGRLPRVKAARTWGGTGSGAPCELCGAAILSNEPELEIELESAPSDTSLRFHRQCHALWDAVRAEVAAGWVCVSDNLPPAETVVEARIQLGAGRIIINVLCRQDPELAAGIRWVNATTGATLPEGWLPSQWRVIGADGPSGEVSANLSRSA